MVICIQNGLYTYKDISTECKRLLSRPGQFFFCLLAVGSVFMFLTIYFPSLPLPSCDSGCSSALFLQFFAFPAQNFIFCILKNSGDFIS